MMWGDSSRPLLPLLPSLPLLPARSPPSPLAALRARLPAEFDEDVYLGLHADLAGSSAARLRRHYQSHGQSEGRRAHVLEDRWAFAALLSPELDVLEIAPYHEPMVTGPRVRYFDLRDKASNIAQAVHVGYPTRRAPDIHYVSPTAELGIVQERFDAAISSHVIEHQPDLIAHLESVRRLLRPGGLYFALLPDKNFCFDHFNALSTIGDLLEAHLERRTRHTVRSQIAFAANRTHNEAWRHWRGDHGTILPSPAVIARLVDEYVSRDGSYVDSHAWYFEPSSFRQAIDLLRALDEIDFSVLRLYPTLMGSDEFWVILEAGRGTG
jgi:SAM-dependent methyltransferase